jgi:multidrug efflux pump
MKITDISIRYRTSILVLTVLLVIGGFIAYSTIPKESSPSIEIPNIVVTTIYPGVSPDDIETLVTQQIEREIQNINGIKEIRSTSTEGVSTIVVEFNPDVSIDDAYQRVRDKVDLAKPNIPTDVEEPMVNEIDISQFPIMTVNLAADYSLARLKLVGEDLQDALEAIPSVLEVDLIGGLDREVQVNVDLASLQAYNLAFEDVIEAISRENTNIPGGSIDVDRLNYLVRVDGNVRDPREIESFVITTPGGRPIYVRDVAEVDFGFKDRESYSRLQVFAEEDEGGRLQYVDNPQTSQVISLNVKKRSGDNIIETAANVNQVIDAFDFPSGTQVVITGDQSKYVEALVRDLENNIISGLIFVIAVLLFFLGVRAATLVGIAIPLSMFIAFLVFSAMGQTLNFIILFSLIIALGMLVDNAIVIVENIYRFREEGYSRFEAARLGTAEVGGAVVASTATTVAAFAPMLLWPGVIGKFMSFMPLTLIITLLSSLFVALVINPVLTGIFVRLDHEKSGQAPPALRGLLAGIALVVGLMLAFANWQTLVVLVIAIPLLYFLHTRFFKPVGDDFVQTGLPRLIRFYRGFLSWMLHRDYSAKRPYLRNTFALGALATGFMMVVAGGALGTVFGSASAVILIPGVVLLFVGVVGVTIHALESLFLGGRTSVIGGLVVGGVMLLLLGIIYLGPREMAAVTIIELLILPIVIIVVGFLGMLFNKRGRTQLILTDNRARLLTGTLAALIAIVLMFWIAPTGAVFFPDTDPNQVRITAEAPLGTNLESSNRSAQQLHARLLDILEREGDTRRNVENLLVSVGVGGDIMFGGGAAGPERSNFSFNLVDYEDRHESSSVTLTKLRDQLSTLPGIQLTFDRDSPGPPTGAPVNIEITGPDFAEIQRITRDVRLELQRASQSGEIPGLVDVADNLNAGRPELQVIIDRERAARFGINTRQIASTVRSAIAGTEAGKYRDGEDEYDITVRLAESGRQTLESLQNLTILYEGSQIPLVAVADLEVTAGLGSITRLDLRRVATVSGDAAPGFAGPEVLGRVQEHLSEYRESLPSSYAMSYTGENEEMADAFGFLTFALLIGVGLIFMIMVAQFNSVIAPLIIMIAVGLSLIGVMLGLIVTRTPFGLMTFIGVISLAGIVVNNAIVLVDYTMQLRERGFSKQDAIIEAGATRLRPVLLTALTTILGLVPLTFGINIDFVGLLTNLDPNFQIGSENTQFWGPMGTAIIAGLTFGTFLTLVIVPVMYSSFDSMSMMLIRTFTNEDDPEGIRSDTMATDRAMAHAPDEVAAGGNGLDEDVSEGEWSESDRR